MMILLIKKTMKKLKHITEICKEIYEEEGMEGVIEHINKALESNNFAYREVHFKKCKGCETETPYWQDECLICGGTY